MQKGLAKNEAKKATQDRFGQLHHSKDGARAKQLDTGKMTLSTQGNTSKFKSSFGDLPPVKKKAYRGTA